MMNVELVVPDGEVKARASAIDVAEIRKHPQLVLDGRDVAVCGPDSVRWVALAVFCFLVSLQGAVWTTFSAVPLAITQAHFGYKVDESTVNLLFNWGNLLYVPALLPAMWLQSQRPRGLINTVRLSAALVAVGAALRCTGDMTHTHVGQIINGIAGPFGWNACASFSYVWFPAEERAFATALGSSASFLGAAFQMLLVVPMRNGHGFKTLLQLEASMSIAVACMAIYLPAQPRRPPSSSALARSCDSADDAGGLKEFLSSLCTVAARRDTWILGLVGGVMSGMFSAYAPSFPIIMGRDEGNTMAKRLGFVSIIAFVAASSIVGWLSERFFVRRLKRLLLLCVLADVVGVSLLAVALPSPFSVEGLCQSLVVHTIAIVLLSCGIGGVFPLCIEMAVEVAYPAEESAVAGAILGLCTVVCAGYLFVMDRIRNKYVNVPILAASLVCFVLVMWVQETYRRRDADEASQTKNEDSKSASIGSERQQA